MIPVPFHIDWLATVGILYGSWLTMHKNWRGWAVSLFMNLTLLPFINIWCGTYAMLLLNLVFAVMAFQAMLAWRREEKQLEEKRCLESLTAKS